MKNRIIGGIILFLLAFAFIIYQNKNYPVSNAREDIFEEKTDENAIEDEPKEIKKIVVCITGEILNPGTYEMPLGARVKDLVDMAGGLKDSSDIARLNLARKLIDEDMIFIPQKALTHEQTIENSNVSQIKSITHQSNDLSKINLNTATIAELDSIPGIGKVTAEKIIQFREQKGFFSSIEQLMEVDRIGETTFNKIKEYVEIY